MKFHTQKTLAAAVALSTVALSGVAGAVAVNADGLGQALVYPYYTARGGQSTLLSVVNTSANAKAVKVRFREGRNSEDVLDFNLFLSPGDVWTGGVSQDGEGAKLTTFDTSCTNPAKSAGWGGSATAGWTAPFFKFAYEATDGDTQTLDRTLEGYVEIIEMAEITTASALFKEIKHVNGVAPCGAALYASSSFVASSSILPPSGGLFGAATFVSAGTGANTGMSTSTNATAYTGFNRTGNIDSPDSVSPNFTDHRSCVAAVADSSQVVIARFGAVASGAGCLAPDQAKAFAAVNMASAVYGEYAYFGDAAILGTDWVITMPGKNYFVNSTTAIAPFTRIWNKTTKRACEDVSLGLTSREEDTPAGSGVGFSPKPPDAPGDSLCYETSVISFAKGASGDSSVLSSKLGLFLEGRQARGESGWLNLGFTGTNAVLGLSGTTIGGVNLALGTPVVSGASVTFTGLPVIGFSASKAKLVAGTVTAPANNYSSSVNLNFKRSITLGQ